MDKRAELIEELEYVGRWSREQIADFILARDNKNAEPLVKSLARITNKDTMFTNLVELRVGVHETLTNLGVESKEK